MVSSAIISSININTTLFHYGDTDYIYSNFDGITLFLQ
jgi:hypothetical protein